MSQFLLGLALGSIRRTQELTLLLPTPAQFELPSPYHHLNHSPPISMLLSIPTFHRFSFAFNSLPLPRSRSIARSHIAYLAPPRPTVPPPVPLSRLQAKGSDPASSYPPVTQPCVTTQSPLCRPNPACHRCPAVPVCRQRGLSSLL